MPPRDDLSASLGSGYHLIELIGEGAMGAVWSAVDRRSGERVAAKLLHGRLIDDPDIVARFVQERSVLLRLRHPGIVAIRDFVIEGGRIAIVMDLVDGTDLGRHLQEAGTLPAARAAGIAAQLAQALSAAHAVGVVHRDVKPGNVLISRPAPGAAETVKLTDFGVARLLQDRAATATAVVGTPSYMAPEVIEGSAPAPAADVYALGMVLYELLAGRAPFSCGNNLTPLHCAFHMAPRRLPGMPEELWAVIAACTAKSPAARPSMPQVAAWLHAALPRLGGVAALPPVARNAPLALTAVPIERPPTPAPSTEATPRVRARGLIIAGVSIAAAVAATVGTLQVVEFGPTTQVAAHAPVDTPGQETPRVGGTASTSPPVDPVPTPDVVGVEPVKKSEKRTARPTPSPRGTTRLARSDADANTDADDRPHPKPSKSRSRSRNSVEPDSVALRPSTRPDELQCRPQWFTVPGQGFAMRPCIRVHKGDLAVIGQVRGNKGVVTDVQVELWDVSARRAINSFVCTGLRFTANGQVKSCGYFRVEAPVAGREYQSRQRWRKPGAADFTGGVQSLGIRW